QWGTIGRSIEIGQKLPTRETTGQHKASRILLRQRPFSAAFSSLDKLFSQVDQSRCLFITETRVGCKAHVVSYLGVGRHFDAALAPRPFFGGRDQCPTEAMPAIFRIDKPTLKITDIVALTIFDKRSDAG